MTDPGTNSNDDRSNDTSADVLVFAGSIRTGSFNRRLATAAARTLRDAGLRVTHVDLSDYPMPIYNADLEAEEGLPEGARRLKELFLAHPAILLACPEYNSSITPLLKNALDWVSRREGDEPPLAAYRGKLAALVSASPGKLGGLRALAVVRSMLGNIGVWVQPTQLAVPGAGDVLGEDGSIADESFAKRLGKVAEELAEAVRRRRADNAD